MYHRSTNHLLRLLVAETISTDTHTHSSRYMISFEPQDGQADSAVTHQGVDTSTMQGTRCVKVVLQPVGDERLVNVCIAPEYRGVKLHECVVCVCTCVHTLACTCGCVTLSTQP